MESSQLNIKGTFISKECPPYIIAEMSANHNGSIDRAIKIIETAKKCGANAIKIQTYTPDTITLNSTKEDFMINGGLWDGRSLYDLYKEAHLPWEWHKDLFNFANEIGITIFSSPFDFSAVDFLESIDAPAYKVASFEATDIPLIEYIASTKKPMIISTGMANFEEIGEAVYAARKQGCSQLALLHCVSGYPAPHGEYNLKTLEDIERSFDVVTGLSDHTVNNVTAIASISLGAAIIEKHFTLSRSDGGADSAFSLEPDELTNLCRDVKIAWEARGTINYDKKPSEIPNIKFRRSLYYLRDISKGTKIASDDFRSVRPGYGLHPKLAKEIIGKTLLNDVYKHTPIKAQDFK